MQRVEWKHVREAKRGCMRKERAHSRSGRKEQAQTLTTTKPKHQVDEPESGMNVVQCI
jgi:hypothetical protein